MYFRIRINQGVKVCTQHPSPARQFGSMGMLLVPGFAQSLSWTRANQRLMHCLSYKEFKVKVHKVVTEKQILSTNATHFSVICHLDNELSTTVTIFYDKPTLKHTNNYRYTHL